MRVSTAYRAADLSAVVIVFLLDTEREQVEL